MNTQQENIIVDSSPYTPIYLVQNTGAIQGRQYLVNVEDSKPITDNLKRFYESSGILENNSASNLNTHSKPRILKKQDSKLVGNNLKLASFLLPKGTLDNNLNKQCLPVNNVILKPVPASNVNAAPKMEVVSASVMSNTPRMEVVSANVSNSPMMELVPANLMTSVPRREVITANVINNTSRREAISANVLNNAHRIEVVSANVVNNVQRREHITSNIINSVPSLGVATTNVVNTVPKVEVDRKIVKLKNFPSSLKTPPRERLMPKSKPKEENISFFSPPNQNHTKHTSVQLLKLGETYHSLNQLSDDQMKMVNQALKIFSNPEKPSMEPTYDPVTNTRFIYKVVSPRELTVVGKNKMKKEEPPKKEPKKYKAEVQVEEEPEPESPPEVKVTRSGRKVKLPKQIVPEDAKANPPKPRKKTGGVVSCFQCSAEFCSLYRLQKHYENHPTHIPAKVHSNLFHCLLAIIKSGSEEDRTNIFIQQLEQLIQKLKSLLPCLMKKIDGSEGQSCTISDDIGRLFGMNPGQYNLNVDALSCVKDIEGNCRHNPPPKNQFTSDPNKPSQLWLSKHNDEIANIETETEDCARINAVDKWPTANKRIKNSKQQKTLKTELNAKKIRLASESETLIELDDLVNFSTANNESAINEKPEYILGNLDVITDICAQQPISEEQTTIINDQTTIINDTDEPSLPKKPKTAPAQFHSAHFDIRSSPIKSSAAATFRKFQINPEKLAKYEVQIIRPLEMDRSEEIPQSSQESPFEPQPDDNTDDLHSIFRDDIMALTCKDPNDIPDDLAFEATKQWISSGLNTVSEKSEDGFMKTNSLDDNFIRNSSLIEPALLHLKGDSVDKLSIGDNLPAHDQLSESDNRLMSNQGSSVLNFLDSLGSECLSYPETEIRNNGVDFQLDLFSFNNP